MISLIFWKMPVAGLRGMAWDGPAMTCYGMGRDFIHFQTSTVMRAIPEVLFLAQILCKLADQADEHEQHGCDLAQTITHVKTCHQDRGGGSDRRLQPPSSQLKSSR